MKGWAGMGSVQRWLKFLVWPGLAMVTAGLVAGGLGGWQWLPVLLVLGGFLLLGAGFSFSADGFWQRRSTQAGTNAAIAVASVLLILALVNFLGVRYNQRIDITENQLFTLAPASQQLARQVDSPVRVVIFDTVQNAQDVQLLESYRQENPRITYEYIDPYSNPQQAQTFGVTTPGMVFLELGQERRLVQTVSSGATATGSAERLSERRLSNGLDQLLNDRALTVYFLQGNGEHVIDGSEPGYQTAALALEDKGYRVETLNLAEAQAVPADADVVVVAGPTQTMFEAEVTALQDYLTGPKGLLLLLDPRADGGLTPILSEWGVILDDRLVLDTSGSGQFVGLGPAAPLVSSYGDHPITQEFGQGRSFFPLVRPIETEELPGITATPLLLTNAQSRAEAISDTGDLSFDPNAAPDGPYILGVALSRPAQTAIGTEPLSNGDAADSSGETSEAGETDAPVDPAAGETPEDAPESRLVVIGNSNFGTDGLFEQQLNGDVFLNAVNWLGQQGDEALSIRPREATNRRILITPQQQWGLGIFSVLVLPSVGMALAVLMWLRRR